jgi:hypothetical protein
MKGLTGWFVAVALVFLSPGAMADFHTFRIQQIYSNADGSVQFVVLREIKDSDGENKFAGHNLTATFNGQPAYYDFPSDLPNAQTAGKYVLIGTQSLAALGVITPDYVMPDHFVPLADAIVNFAGVDALYYPALPTDGVNAIDRDGNIVPNVAKNFAGQSAAITVPVIVPTPVANYEGLWWNSPPGSESGWGINFAHQGDVIFATWFTYDTNGKPVWLAVSANRTAPGVYAGDLFTTSGPAFSAVPFDSNAVVETTVGTAKFTFADSRNASFAYTVNDPLGAGVSTQVKSITRQEFASPLPDCTWNALAGLATAHNYQDLWWKSPAGSEAGWGINFTHQGDTIFATWFTYDASGKPRWLAVSANRTAPGVYSGDLFTTTGPPLSAVPFNPGAVVETTVGTATLTFADGNSATFAYSVNGVSQTKPITRQVFTAPGTLCQ